MNQPGLKQLSSGVNTLKRMTMDILPHRKRKTKGRKGRKSRKSKKGKKGRKGKKSRRPHRRHQRGGSTVSYGISTEPLGFANLNMASPAPIAPSPGSEFYRMPGTSSSGFGSYI